MMSSLSLSITSVADVWGTDNGTCQIIPAKPNLPRVEETVQRSCKEGDILRIFDGSYEANIRAARYCKLDTIRVLQSYENTSISLLCEYIGHRRVERLDK